MLIDPVATVPDISNFFYHLCWTMLVIGNIIVGKLYQLLCNFIPKLFKGLFHPSLLQLFRRKSNLTEKVLKASLTEHTDCLSLKFRHREVRLEKQ